LKNAQNQVDEWDVPLLESHSQRHDLVVKCGCNQSENIEVNGMLYIGIE
jgi:hypothetical protein